MARPKQNFKIAIPESWDEITLEKFIQLQSLYQEENKPTIKEIISVLSEIPLNELNQYPAIIIEKIADKIDYLKDNISNDILNYIDIDGERYTINHMEELKFGEYVDVQTVLDGDRNNFPAILGILCRKEGEIYNDDFIALELNKRIEMFAHQPITKIYPMIGFFLNLYLLSPNNIQLFSEKLKDHTNHILTVTEDLVRSGTGLKRFMNSPMKKLKKLRKQLNSI